MTDMRDPAITYAGFITIETAREWKGRYGGWIFVADDNGPVIWFDASQFTPSTIMLHRTTSGLTGRLV